MARMTLDQLQIFLAVAQHLHFTRAADALYISQPAVSVAIQSLEKQYQVKLFHRIGRRVELTDAGRMLQKEAQKILEQVDLAERGLLEFNNLQQGSLKLGASQTIGNYWLPHFISQFRHHYPGIRVDCTLGNTQEISAAVVAGLFDLGLVEGEVQLRETEVLSEKVVGSHRLRIVVGQFHPWFNQSIQPVAALTTTAWVMREAGSGTRQRFEQLLRQWGIEPTELNVIVEMKSGAMVKAAVARGVAAAAISEMMIANELQLNILRSITLTGAQNAIPLDQLVLPFVLLRHRQRFPTGASQAFEQLLMRQS